MGKYDACSDDIDDICCDIAGWEREIDRIKKSDMDEDEKEEQVEECNGHIRQLKAAIENMEEVW